MTASATCAQCRRGHHDRCSDPEHCDCTECGQGLVEWEDPPGGRGRAPATIVTDAQIALLRSHPKRWAKINEYAKSTSAASTAARIKKGTHPELAPAEWEAAARRTSTGSALYLRYTGGADDAA